MRIPTLWWQGAVGLKRFNTGGSSGQPLVFIWEMSGWGTMSAKRAGPLAGGASISVIRKLSYGDRRSNWAQDRLRLLRDRLFRTELLSAFETSNRISPGLLRV